MHKLIERQLKKATHDGTVDVDLLCRMVSAAYDEADAERALNANALDALQADLETAARRVRQDAEARFNVAMDNVGEAVIVIDELGRIESFNKAAERIFGYSNQNLHGVSIDLLMGGQTHFGHHQVISQYLRTGKAGIIGIGREITARRHNGEDFPAELAIGEVQSAGRRSFIGIIRDITARKQMEYDLRESESRFRDLAGSASDWFWETDTDYRLTFVSERIASVLGVKPAAILGHSFFDIGLGDGNDRLAASHDADLRAQRPFRDVVFHVGPQDGKDAKTIRISGIPMFGADGRFSGYRGVGADITREAAAESRAKLAQQYLADAIESLVDAIGVFDSDDRLVIFNSQYRKTFGTAADQVFAGAHFEDIIHAGLAAGIFHLEGLRLEHWLDRRMAKHREASGEAFLMHMQNGRCFLSREFRTRDGGTVGVRTDITEMKQREAELEALRHRYELILGAAGEGIIGLNQKGRITFANQTAGTILGYTPDEMIGNCFHALIQLYDFEGEPYPYDSSAVRQAYLHGAAIQVNDDVFWRFDGSFFHVEYQVTPMRENDQLAGAVLIFRDATLRLRYEEGLADQQRQLERLVSERTGELQREVQIRNRTEVALRASRERLKGIADSLFEGVLVINRLGQLVFANASARRLLQCDTVQGDLEGHMLDGLMRLRAGDGGDVLFDGSPWQMVTDQGVTLRDDDAAFITATGTQLAVAYACSPIREDGVLRAAIISFRDIENLKQAQREALQASRLASVGQLAAGIAHEINTPVQYIGDNLRFIATALAKLPPILDAACQSDAFQQAAAAAKLPYLLEELPIAVEESQDGVAQIARIVLSMKEFSHPGTTAQSATDLNRAIESTLTVCRNTWKHVAEVVRQLDDNLPLVVCYAGEMNQVFLNLIVNAAHAIEECGKPLPGTIRIATRQRGDWVEISIADSGNGVPDSIAEKIFDPFFTTKAVGKGTGQGLAICRDVVTVKHGGQITLDSIEGGGATFTIRLPLDGLNSNDTAPGA